MDSENYVLIDIETVPLKFEQEEILNYLIEKRFPRGRHPAFSKIFVIGLKEQSKETIIFRNENEKEILEEFWKKLEEINPDRIVTWNGFRFDVPFLEVRSRINGIKIPLEIEKNKWNMFDSNHIDCMWLLSGMNKDFKWIRLDIASTLLGIEHNRKVTGREIEKLYRENDWETIENHCKEDLRMLEEIYKKLKPTLSKPGEEKATEKQVDYVMNLARIKDISLDREEVKEWSKSEASKWIDKHKD